MSGRHSSTPPPRPALPTVTRSGRAARATGVERVVHRLEGHRAGLRRTAGGFAALAVVGATLSMTASPGEAIGGPLVRADKGFAGYSATSTASPLKVEIFEPTIPLPAEPQVELSVGYSKVVADSTSSRARASYLWPGDPVGEGFKTIIEQLGLPPELAAPLGENGYPVQVNALFPSGPEAESDEPLPGSIQRAVAGEDTARADNAFSLDGEVKDGESGSDGGDDDGGATPGLPTLPGLPGLSGLTDMVMGGLGGGSSTTPKAAAAAPVLPGPLGALIDVGGLTATARTDNTKQAYAQGRSTVGDITLLGGLISIEGVTTISTASSDGTTGKPVGSTVYGDIVVAGQRFTYGPDGFEAAGTKAPIPGLPTDGAGLLKTLGVKISVPKPVTTKTGDAATTTIDGLIVDLDLKVLRAQLRPLLDVLDMVVGQLPDQLGPVKSAVQAVANLAPRIVLHLGTSSASVDTSAAIPLPPVPPTTPTDPTDTTTDTTPTTPSVVDGAGGTLPPSDTSVPTDSTVPDAGAPTDEAGIDPVSSSPAPGLPPLLSFPGLLLYGGLIGAGVAGFFVRRLGALALGAAGSCPHGLTSGLPDLRKA